ncbi:MAG TPA: hypothetical protein VF323_01690 [Candidatus Limnocylindrales bacterium]
MVPEDRPADARPADPDLTVAGGGTPPHGTPGVDLVAAAVFNNAVWCDAVCQALGCDTDFVDDLWINSGTSPPFYPNAITLAPHDPDAQLRRIRLIADRGLPPGWSVKDAFATLDLSGLGYRVLFEAEWLGLPAGRAPAALDVPGVRWEPVTSGSRLDAWEDAWRNGPDDASVTTHRDRIFVPALLADPDIVFFAADRDGQVVGVVVGNRSDDGSGPVVGISNLVLPAEDGERLRAGAVAAVRSAFPDLPMVCYERGADLRAMASLGFDPLGPLRVWGTS